MAIMSQEVRYSILDRLFLSLKKLAMKHDHFPQAYYFRGTPDLSGTPGWTLVNVYSGGLDVAFIARNSGVCCVAVCMLVVSLYLVLSRLVSCLAFSYKPSFICLSLSCKISLKSFSFGTDVYFHVSDFDSSFVAPLRSPTGSQTLISSGLTSGKILGMAI